jgi:hypothetical protein
MRWCPAAPPAAPGVGWILQRESFKREEATTRPNLLDYELSLRIQPCIKLRDDIKFRDVDHATLYRFRLPPAASGTVVYTSNDWLNSYHARIKSATRVNLST